MGWRGVIVDERHGLQVLVEPLRWRVQVLNSCPADVRAALADGIPLEGTARFERESIEQGLMALGRVQGYLLARRQPRQAHIFAAAHVDDQRDRDWLALRMGVQAACLAVDRGWSQVAASILAHTRALSAGTYALSTTAHEAARKVADRFAADLRRRGLPL